MAAACRSTCGDTRFFCSEAQLFLARRNGEVVGRIAAIHNRRHLETWNDGAGFFGFFESIEDREVAHALCERAAAWLAPRGMTKLRGPMSFTINDECALLLDAFDQPPVVLMSYNPPYYRDLLESWGFAKAQDLLAYRLDVPEAVPPRLAAAARLLARAPGLVIRPIDMKHLDEEVRRIHKIHSAAWAENWGAVPLTEGELAQMAKELVPIVDPDLAFLAEQDGEPVGVSISIPDVHQALIHLGGHLLPIGWAKFLWYKRRITALRVLIMGVVAEHRLRGIDAAMIARTFAVGIAKGYRWGELSWILESNGPMRRVLERLGARVYKTYRVYERAI